jgi:segregation and condensation protein A
MSLEVHLDVFEGPFELLLSLITEKRLDVCDVPIARLTEDYLRRLDERRELDLETATEFLVVAATLLLLKARALLPAQTGDEPGEEHLDRDVLIARLLEVRTFQAAGDQIALKLDDGDRRFTGAPARDDPSLRVMPTLAGIESNDLARVLVDLIAEGIRRIDTGTLLSDEISPEDAAAELMRLASSGAVLFPDAVRDRSVSWRIALFLALLELSMRGELDARQEAGAIRVSTTSTGGP